MPLKISLKPREKLYIGGAVVVNGDSHAELSVMNSISILREKEILTEETANSPCRRIYLTIQLMYMDHENLIMYHESYWTQVKDIVAAAPSFAGLLQEVSEYILIENYYKALKLTKKLIDKETEVIKNAELCVECV